MADFAICKNSDGQIEAIKQGWSWPAFFFGQLWALTKEMLSLDFLILGVAFLLGIIFGLADVEFSEVNLLVLLLGGLGAIFLGASGNSLREKNLQSRGYEYIAIVESEYPENAIIQYINASQAEEANNHENRPSGNLSFEYECTDCGATVDANDSICPQCGGDLTIEANDE